MRRIGRHRCSWVFAWGSLCLLGAFGELGTKAWAQAQQSDNPAAPDQSYLTGDWGGVRSSLERLGVTFTFNYTNDFLANVGGGIKIGGVGLGIFQPHVDLDLQKLLGWEGDRIHIDGLVTHGPFFSAN
jgi:porin